MNVSSSHGLREMSFDTAQKTVHKSDINKLARSINTVLQSASEMVVELKSQKPSADQKITNMIDAKAIRQTLSDQLVEVNAWKTQLVRSSYEHASFKADKLNSMAKKIDSAIDNLRSAKEAGIDGNPFLDGLRKVTNQGEAKGLKLDQDHKGKIGWVFDENNVKQ